jgi:LSD1 subclass zinc finger protein
MAIIQCGSCQRRLRLPDEAIGKKVRCPACQAVFVATAAPEEPPVAELVEDESTRSAKAPRPGRLRTETFTAQENEESGKRRSPSQAGVRDYRKGMKSMGNSLIALGILYLILAVLALLTSASSSIESNAPAMLVGLVLLLFAFAFVGAGVLARWEQSWINYPVAALSVLCLCLALLNLLLSLASGKLGSAVPVGLQTLISALLLSYSLRNLRNLYRARKAGADV